MSAPIELNVKLRDIVYEYMEAGRLPDAAFLRLWRMALNGFTEMGFNAFFLKTSVKLTVNENNTANLPDDYLQWLRIGNINERGEFKTLAINKDLANYKDSDSDRLSEIKPETPSFDSSSSSFLTTNVLTQQGSFIPPFGLGSHLLQDGEFNVDMNERLIVLNPNYSFSNVCLDYLASPLQNEDYEIPVQFKNAMMAWLYWKDNQFVPPVGRTNIGVRRDAARVYANQFKLAKKMFKPFRESEANQYSREAVKYNVKG